MALDRRLAPNVNDFNTLNIPPLRVVTLDNGIKLNILDQGEFNVNRLTMSWAGGANDVDNFSALMLATELMREGSSFHNGSEIAETLDFNGAWLKCNFHSHHTAQILYSLNSRFNEVLPIIVETITSPTFPMQEFEINREKIAKRKELNISKVAYLSNIGNQQLIFGESHPCSKDETPDEIRNITINDIKNIHKKIFTPNSCELFLAGRITPTIEDLINNSFGQISSTIKAFTHRVIPINPSNNKIKIIDVPQSLQSAITLSIPTISRSHPDYIDLRYTIMALGGYFGSRLMSNIREEKGYTYGISAALYGNWEGGVMSVTTQCDNKYVNAVISETKQEIERLKSGDFDDDEINRLKRFATSQIAGTLDSPFHIMDYYENTRHVLTSLDYFQEMQKSLNNLTPKRIASLAQQYLNTDEIRISIAGNKNKIV